MPDGLTQDYIDKLREWRKAGPGRELTITIKDDYKGNETIRTQCWDAKLLAADYVTPPAMPDVPAKIRADKLAKLAELQAEFAEEGKP